MIHPTPEGAKAVDWQAECDHYYAESVALRQTLKEILSEIKKYHTTFDARLFVKAERQVEGSFR